MPILSSSDSGKQMFKWFLKPRFYSKCHTYVKFIKTRLETIQKKRNAVQKFMKGDLAELLRNGLDYDAYKRVERLILEQNTSYCYELIAKFIGCISDNLKELTKQSDCPDECKEAVPSLMYAAAGVADIPELRDLRTLFSHKFGNSLEPYTSIELIEKLRRDPPAREMKIRLLHDIAKEFSIEWDEKALEQIISGHPSLHKERPMVDKTDNVVTKEKHNELKDFNTSKGKERDTPSQSQAIEKDFSYESYWKPQSSDDDNDNEESSTDTSSIHGRKASQSSLESIVSEDEVENKRPNPYWLVPPPYLKQRTNKEENNSKKTTTITDSEVPIPRSSRRRNLKSIPTQEHNTNNIFDSVGTEYDTGQNNGRSYARGKSLPYEHANSAESSKGHARSISLLSSEIKSGEGKAHPNLPDYDDLLASLRSLRGR